MDKISNKLKKIKVNENLVNDNNNNKHLEKNQIIEDNKLIKYDILDEKSFKKDNNINCRKGNIDNDKKEKYKILQKSNTNEIKINSNFDIIKEEKTKEEQKIKEKENTKNKIVVTDINGEKNKNDIKQIKEEYNKEKYINNQNNNEDEKNNKEIGIKEESNITVDLKVCNTIKFNNLTLQNCFRFSIKNKKKQKDLKRNFSELLNKNQKNYEYTSITERILNKSGKNKIENNHNSVKKINKYKLNFNSLNLYKNSKNYKLENRIICDSDKTNCEINLTNYFKLKNFNLESDSSSIDKECKTSRTNIKNKALFQLLNDYIIQDNETEKILVKLYQCSDFNLYNLFQTFLGTENKVNFNKSIISINDIYNTLINLNCNNINLKDISYIFLKFNKNINKKEKINNIGFSLDEFYKIMKPLNNQKNITDKKNQKYFMGFSFRTNRIICSLFKQFISSEKSNEIYRRQLMDNETNKYKIKLKAENLFNCLKRRNNVEYLLEDDFECFTQIFGKKMQKFEKILLMKRFDKNKNGFIFFNDFFNEIIPKTNIN